ncbi:ROK family protein [Virgibacillus litoralis]|uniref:Glucokinase n=1 Tax=Virgibacillus litoralis TaxID=578221 RepID=A0ABS4HAE6_9BACI|nr:glucokinase [Virgibacillus litoralis]
MITLDVGGTSIHAAAVSSNGVVPKETIATYPSLANEPKDVILNHIKNIIVEQIKLIMELKSDVSIVGIGIAFPGPCDYQSGVCYIKDLAKYESLYGTNVKEELQNRLAKKSFIISLSLNNLKVLIENDAVLFALGEYVDRYKKRNVERIASFTLGTGIGSVFMDQGDIVKGHWGVPESGNIFNVPFKKGIIDDYISKRGILNLAQSKGFDSRELDVRELAALAIRGEKCAMEAFNDFGAIMGEAVNPFIDSVKPEVIVFGGQIAKSYQLFESHFKGNLSDSSVKVDISYSPLISTFIGAASLFNK